MTFSLRQFSLTPLASRINALLLFLLTAAFVVWVVYVYASLTRFTMRDFPIHLGETNASLLLPIAAELINAVVPTAVESWMVQAARPLPLVPDYITSYILIFLAAIGAVTSGFAWIMFLLARHFFPQSPGMGWVTAILSLYAIPAFALPDIYYFDFVTLLLNAGCLLALCKRRMDWYGFLFALAVLNDFRNAWMALFFLLAVQRYLTDREVVRVWLVQLAAMLMGGAYATLQDPEVLRSFIEPDIAFSLAGFLDGYDFTRLTAWCVAGLMLTYHYEEKPEALRLSLWLLLPYGIEYFFDGAFHPWRIFYGVLPFVMLLISHTLCTALHGRHRAQD